MTPKPEMTLVGLPAPAPADYSDEISEEYFARLLEDVKEYQACEGEIVSGEPW